MSYDPNTGRFLSEDPIGFAAGDPNLYRFVGNSPLNFTDPSGLTQAGNPLDALSSSLAGGFSGGIGGLVSDTVSNIAGSFLPGLSGIGAGLSSIGSSVISSDSFRSAAGVANTVLNAGLNLATASPGTFTEFSGLINQRADLTTQINTLDAQIFASQNRDFSSLNGRNRRSAVLSNARQLSSLNDQRLILGSQRATTTAQAQDLAFSTLFGGERIDIVNNALKPLERASYIAAIGSGLRTGGKAVGNATASSLTLGFYDGPFSVTDTDRLYGYDSSRLIAGVSTELLVGAATGYSTRVAGTAGRAAFAFDATSNVVGAGRGIANASRDGLNLGNGFEIAGGLAGLGGNASGLREALIRNRIDDYVGGLDFKLTPTGSPANRFEIRNTGPLNHTAVGGGSRVDIDGFSYRHRAILEAKYVGSPLNSPYISGSGIPSKIRDKILSKQANEFGRLADIVSDSSTPFNSIRVVTNTAGSRSFFQQLGRNLDVPVTVARGR